MAEESDVADEPTYAKQTWIWILLTIVLLVGVVAVVALILPFLYSPSYPTGYTVTPIDTQISGGSIVPQNSVTASNRSLYVFKAPSAGPGTLSDSTIGNLSFAGVKQGMQFLVSNNTGYPLNVTAGTTAPFASFGKSVATVDAHGEYNKCIPTATSLGSFAFFLTKSTIPPGATFFFVAPSDNNLNLVQSTPIDVTYSGTFNAPICLSA